MRPLSIARFVDDLDLVVDGYTCERVIEPLYGVLVAAIWGELVWKLDSITSSINTDLDAYYDWFD